MPTDVQTNLSQYVPPEINDTLNSVQNPKAFGDQLVNTGKQIVKTTLLNAVDILKREIEAIVIKKINLEINHILNLQKIQNDSKPTQVIIGVGTVEVLPPVLNEAEYTLAVTVENVNYETAKNLLNKQQEDLQKRLINIVQGPYKQIEAKYKDYKARQKVKKARPTAEKNRANREKIKQFAQFALKSLSTIIAQVITKQVIKIITDNDNLQKLVDQTNAIIEAATTLEALNQARVARNSCINVINKQESKIRALLKILNVTKTIADVLNAVILVLAVIPPGLPIIAKALTILYEFTRRIVSGLRTILSIVIPMLESAIEVLEDLKRQLRELNQLLEERTLEFLDDLELSDYLDQILKSSSDPLSDINRLPGESDEDYYDRLRNSQSLLDYLGKRNLDLSENDLKNQLNSLNPLGLQSLANRIQDPNANQFGEYKGFKFAIKEENDPKFVVRGNKRHYAVAINKLGVEILKSASSFTLDPQQLVEQLKIIIDQQDLQG